jgi:hypothetical protein
VHDVAIQPPNCIAQTGKVKALDAGRPAYVRENGVLAKFSALFVRSRKNAVARFKSFEPAGDGEACIGV